MEKYGKLIIISSFWGGYFGMGGSQIFLLLGTHINFSQ